MTVSTVQASTVETGIRVNMSKILREHWMLLWVRLQQMQQREQIIWTSFIWMYGIRMRGRQDRSQKRSTHSDGDSLRSLVTRESMTLPGHTGQLTPLMVEQAWRDGIVRLSGSSAMTREIRRFWTIRGMAEQPTTRCLADIVCMALKDGAEIRIITLILQRHLQRTCLQDSFSIIM